MRFSLPSSHALLEMKCDTQISYEMVSNAHVHQRTVSLKNQTKWEMTHFESPTQFYMEVGPHEGCSKMSIIEVIHCCHGNTECFSMPGNSIRGLDF